jgi:2-polyprenyl-6-methoxyphenol hydroxylase-like FAD-dependent oxidoreductase
VIYSPVEEVRLPPPWNVRNVLVAGDAAHACAPHLTQGGAQALEDAVVLAEELAAADSVSSAIERFTERRAPRATRVQELAHTILAGEMNPDEEHRQTWPAKFGRLMGEANALLAVPA